MVGFAPVLLGATGQLGTAMRRLLPDARVVGREQLDLAVATPEDVRTVITPHRPDAVINCAAFTAVDTAEDEEATALTVNGEAVGQLAEATAELGIPLLTYSTDYVFAGTANSPYLESDPTDPVNAYGRTKLVGELAALAANPRSLVIRTSWVVSGTHPNFLVAILTRALADQPLRVVDDQRGCPTVAADLATASLAALDAGASGLLHLTNSGATTWFDLARATLLEAGMGAAVLEPCSSAEYPTRARRPAYSVLGSEVLPSLPITPMPDWRDSLAGVVSGALEVARR